MESVHSLILHACHITRPCAIIATLAGEKSKWLSKVLRVQILLLVLSGSFHSSCVIKDRFRPATTGERNTLPDRKEIQQCSRARGPDLRITGLKPAHVIGRDIVISRDHLSLICHSPPLPLTLSFMLGCRCTSQFGERLNRPPHAPRWRFLGSFASMW